MCVHAKGITHIMRSTMKELEKLLDPNIFQRIHRSTIVNITQVVNLTNHANGELVLILKNKTQLKISRGRKNKIKDVLNNSMYF